MTAPILHQAAAIRLNLQAPQTTQSPFLHVGEIMTNSDHPGLAQDRDKLRLIQLFVEDNRTMVLPTPDQAPATPFILPLLPRTMTDFVSHICESIWQAHQRCAGILFLFDVAERRWGLQIPHQRAGRHCASWTTTANDVAEISDGAVIAGSFQVRVLQIGETPKDAVPPFDGVHFVMEVAGDRRVIWSFLSVGGSVRRVPASQVILDELALAMEECDRRLSLV